MALGSGFWEPPPVRNIRSEMIDIGWMADPRFSEKAKQTISFAILWFKTRSRLSSKHISERSKTDITSHFMDKNTPFSEFADFILSVRNYKGMSFKHFSEKYPEKARELENRFIDLAILYENLPTLWSTMNMELLTK